MKTRKVVHIDNLPMKFPLIPSVLAWLVLENVNPEGWIIGVSWTVIALWWIVAIFDKANSESVKVIND